MIEPRPSIAMALLHLLARFPRGLRPGECFKALPEPRPSYSGVHLNLAILHKEGYIMRVGHGRYTLHPLHGWRVLGIERILEHLADEGRILRAAGGRYKARMDPVTP
jgi:hypothetical protein